MLPPRTPHILIGGELPQNLQLTLPTEACSIRYPSSSENEKLRLSGRPADLQLFLFLTLFSFQKGRHPGGYVHCRAKRLSGLEETRRKRAFQVSEPKKAGASYRVTLHPEQPDHATNSAKKWWWQASVRRLVDTEILAMEPLSQGRSSTQSQCKEKLI